MGRFDVAVVGLGAMGSMAAWRCARRGASTVGFDRFTPPHDRGGSHGESRIIRTAYAEGDFYVPLLLEAWDLWRELEAASGCSLLETTGALMIGPQSGRIVGGALASARRHRLQHELLDAKAAMERWPQHVLGPDEVALHEPKAGVLRPEAAITAALGSAGAAGALLRTETQVESIHDGGDAIHVQLTDGETVRAGSCIVAAGAWTGRLLPHLAPVLRVERQVVGWFGVEKPELFRPRRFPVFMHELPGGGERYGLPSLDDATVKIAVHHEGATVDADTVSRTVTAQDLAPAVAFTQVSMRWVRPRLERSIVCLYTNTPDQHLIAGALPGSGNVIVVGGCSGHSFKFSSVFGDIAADLALQRLTARDVTELNPARPSLRADGRTTGISSTSISV